MNPSIAIVGRVMPPSLQKVLAFVLIISPSFSVHAADDLFANARQRFSPLPDTLAEPGQTISPERSALGRKLFFDKRLSVDGSVSCETCHLPGLHATDGLNRSIGVEHRLNLRNAPTLLNAALQFRIHWDGARQDVEDQATQSLVGPASFGNKDYQAVISKLKALGYEHDFQKAFPDEKDPIQPANWGKAIGSFERTLVSPSAFDAYLKGNMYALNDSAKEGLRLFMDIGCANCHDGILLGGMRYAKFGLFEDVPSKTDDEGRAGVTHAPADRMVFKVAPLRNVAMTPPYFHDGSVDDLGAAIRVMGKVQLARDLADADVSALKAFLESLTGAIPADFKAP
jgi:cytochrome c peroxidase